MSFSVVIPARYASTRLPGKPLVEIAGKPMVQHVYERARLSNAERVLVATDHEGIQTCVQQFGGDVCLTKPTHPSGTDRLQEVAKTLNLADDYIVVNVQGDEPLIPAAVINQVAENLAAHPEAGIATLVEKITDADTLFDPNVVKAVSNSNGYALYFSRAPIPWHREGFIRGKDNLADTSSCMPVGQDYFRHIGIYAYRVSFLHRFITWPEGLLEQTEKLEQLRALENGIDIHIAEAIEPIPSGVDTPEDLNNVRAFLEGDRD